MLDNKGFDMWAKDYDKSVETSSKEYPFDGYYDVLTRVYNLVEEKKDKKILDVGFGTGLLTGKLYEARAEIYGMDFSQAMIDIAKEKMPQGIFLQGDFNNGVPQQWKNLNFDYIVSSYAIHHLTDDEKVNFIGELKNLLNETGKIIIADVAFEAEIDLNKCRETNIDSWDEDEIYMVAEKITAMLKEKNINSRYTQVSSCAGILEIY